MDLQQCSHWARPGICSAPEQWKEVSRVLEPHPSAAALVSTTVAYYVMWVLAIVVFALAVYYTVKQL